MSTPKIVSQKMPKLVQRKEYTKSELRAMLEQAYVNTANYKLKEKKHRRR